MDLTESYETAIPARIRERYELLETRNAAAILGARNPESFRDVLGVLEAFHLTEQDITVPGGSESTVAKRLNEGFRDLGWREGRVDIVVALRLRPMPYRGTIVVRTSAETWSGRA